MGVAPRTALYLLCSAALALPGGFPGFAHAQCNFDAPTKARGFKSSMVRAYDACTTSNTAVDGGVADGCNPPTVLSAFQFSDSKSSCTVAIRSNFQSPCKWGWGAVACNNPIISLKCRGIVGSDGVTPIGSPGSAQVWTLEVGNRATFEDPVGGDMTAMDSPVAQFLIPPARNGKLKLKTHSFRLDSFGECSGLNVCGLPGCSVLEISGVRLVDPEGNVFAVTGSSTR